MQNYYNTMHCWHFNGCDESKKATSKVVGDNQRSCVLATIGDDSSFDARTWASTPTLLPMYT